LLGRQAVRNRGAVQGDLRLQDLGGFRLDVERPGQRDSQGRPAPLDHASKFAGVAVRHAERRTLSADGERNERAPLARKLERRREGPEKRESLEVDTDQTKSGLLARDRERVDELAVRNHQEDALLADSVLDRLRQHLEVEHGLVDRNW
jgi:hypothetical protein